MTHCNVSFGVESRRVASVCVSRRQTRDCGYSWQYGGRA